VQALLDASERTPTDGASSGDGPDHALRALTRTMLGFASERTPFYASYVRERGRLSGRAQTAARRAEARLTERWREAVAEAGIELDQRRVGLRLTSVLTALREMSLSADPGDLQRNSGLVADAIVGVWRAPTCDEPAPVPVVPGYHRPALRTRQILEAALALLRAWFTTRMDDIARRSGWWPPASTASTRRKPTSSSTRTTSSSRTSSPGWTRSSRRLGTRASRSPG
jgi:hypothetical protein